MTKEIRTSRGSGSLPGSEPQTLAELAGSASPHTPVRLAVATAERRKLRTYSRLTLQQYGPDTAENVFLRGVHFIDVVAAKLYEETHTPDGTAIEATTENVTTLYNATKPYFSAYLNLQLGVNELSSLVSNNQGEVSLRSVHEAKVLLGEKFGAGAEEAFNAKYGPDTPLGKFIGEYPFEETGVSAAGLMAKFLEESFETVTKEGMISYEEPSVKEVMLDSLGADATVAVLSKGSMRTNNASVTGEADDPFLMDESGRKAKIAQAFSLVSHEWATPLTTLKMQFQRTERSLYPAEGGAPDMGKASSIMNRFISVTGLLEKLRHDMHDALSKGFVPVRIPVAKLLADTSELLISHLRDRVSFGDASNLPEEAVVSISPSVLNGIINNAIQNAERARWAWLVNEEHIDPEIAQERARNEVTLQCSVMVNEKARKLRLLFTDNGRGITRGRRTHHFTKEDHGFDAPGVSSNGIAMYQYADQMREDEGFLYLVQSPHNSGATLVATFPFQLDE